jgi:LysM repeat protein
MAVYRKALFVALILVLVLLAVVPVASAAAPSSTSDAAAYCWYKVRWGDTLAKIAGSYGTSVAYLKSINHLANANRIWAGQWLKVPCKQHPGRHYYWSDKYHCWGYSYYNAYYGRYIFICTKK